MDDDEEQRRWIEKSFAEFQQRLTATTDRDREVYRAALAGSRPFFQTVFGRAPTVDESEQLARWALAMRRVEMQQREID